MSVASLFTSNKKESDDIDNSNKSSCNPLWRNLRFCALLLLTTIILVTLLALQLNPTYDLKSRLSPWPIQKIPKKIRMVTQEELERHDGKQTKGVMWLSILSKVYDVSKGAQYYGPGGSYSIFVGRDANVPFITGNFDEEEAAKLVTDLTPPQLFNLHTWIEFYENEEKYPFVGLLEGNLYDKDGMPTAMMKEVQAMIDEGRASNEEFQRKKQERRDRRMREDAEKKKREEDSKLKQQESQILTPSKSRDSREALLLETKVTEEL